MFKSGRWKGQNSKIKVMFQMQFQATQVPKIKGKGLMISLIPADIGKPVARLEKAAVVEGTCKWETPIYERVKLIKNQKMETYKEKIYFFNVASGSSKSGFVGEVGVNFADFVEATEPFQISLPLTASNSGAILHVFVQKMQAADELRESEESGSLRSESVRLKNQTSDCSENANILDFAEDDYSSKNNPNFKENTTVRRNSKPSAENHVQQRSSIDWSLGSLSDRSMADLLNSPEQTYQTQRLPEASTNAMEVLKRDVLRLERQAELSDIELESLRKQIVKENKRGQDLLRKISELREEKEALKTECEMLKSPGPHPSESPEDLTVLLDEIRQELKQEKDLNKVLTMQLQKTEESNSELLIAVEDLNRTMEEKDTQISYLSEKQKTKDSATKQKIEGLYEEIEIYKKDKEEMKLDIENFSLEYKYLQDENDEMSSKLEKTQLEQTKMQSEYSKSLTIIKENELQVKRLEEKIMNQALELSQSLDIITELETHVKSLEKELEKQGCDFEDDVEDLMKAKIEQEQRVIEAVSEAQNLHKKIGDLQEALKETNDELLLTKDLYKEKVQKLCDQIEKMSRGENNEMSREWIREREILMTEFDSLKKESTNWASLMNEKNVMIRTLKSELKMLRSDYKELQQRLLVIELEKDNLQGEVSRLEHDLRKKEDELKGSKVDTSNHDESRSIFVSAKSNERSNDQHKVNKLLSEISSLDERNKHMESELKEMQEKYSEISLRFAQVEGERQELVMTVRNLRNGKKK